MRGRSFHGDREDDQDHGPPGFQRSRGFINWEWLLEAPRVRLRTTRDRLLAQLGELAVLNERLAGNEARDARARIEFLQTRRRNWERIFDYVTKQDVAATLAVIEEANKKVVEALSEDRSERSGVASLKRHLLDLQGEVAAAQQRLSLSQARLEHNLQRIQELQREAASMEERTGTSSSALASAPSSLGVGHQQAGDVMSTLSALGQAIWYPIAFAACLQPDTMLPFDLFNIPWVLFRDAEGQVACIRDQCAHRACPLSLGTVVEGRAQCPYHGWEYERDGACVRMPSTTQIPGVAVSALPCSEQDGLLWVATSAPGPLPMSSLPTSQPPPYAQYGPDKTVVAQIEVEEEGVDAGALLEVLLAGSFPVPAQTWALAADSELASKLAAPLATRLRKSFGGLLPTFHAPCAVHTLLDMREGGHAATLEQLHVCLPSRSGRVRVLLQLCMEKTSWAGRLPGITAFWEHTARKALKRDLLLAKTAGPSPMLNPWQCS